MADGVKKPVNVFRLKNLPEPKEVFNWRLWFAVVSFGLMGAARGIDEGLISGAFNSKDFQRSIHYDRYSKVEQTNIKGNVSAMVQIGSVGGALLYVLSRLISQLHLNKAYGSLILMQCLPRLRPHRAHLGHPPALRAVDPGHCHLHGPQRQPGRRLRGALHCRPRSRADDGRRARLPGGDCAGIDPWAVHLHLHRVRLSWDCAGLFHQLRVPGESGRYEPQEMGTFSRSSSHQIYIP